MSNIDKALKLRQELESVTQAAIDELLLQRKDIDTQLRALGHAFPEDRKGARKTGIRRIKDANEPCKVCGFVTEPPHDGRAHRSQGTNKKKFTEKELAELGYKKK